MTEVVTVDDDENLLKRFSLVRPRNGVHFWWTSGLFYKLSATVQLLHEGKVCCFQCLERAVKEAKAESSDIGVCVSSP